MATATPVAGAVPLTQFTPAQQAQLRAGQKVGTFQVLNGHVMDLRTPQGQALLTQRTTAQTAAAPVTAGTAPSKGGWMDPNGGVVQPPPQTGTAAFDPNAAADQATKDANNRSALALIRDTLNQYDLPQSLADWAWSELVAGKGEAEVLLDLRQRPEFKQRFPGIDQRQKAGLAPLSPAEYVAYEQAARQVMRAAGLPQGMYDSPDDFTKWIAGDVSIKELSDRVGMYEQAAYAAPPEDRAAFSRYYGGMGDLTAILMDDKLALPLIKQKWAAAQVGGAADRTGVAADQALAEHLAGIGVTPDQATQGFAQIGQLGQEVTHNLPGEASQIGNISLNDEANAVFAGDATQRKRLSDRQRERTAVFDGGGGFAQTRGGTAIGGAQAA